MAHKEGEKQVTLWVDQEEKEQFSALCKTMGTSVSSVIKTWMMKAITEQTLEISLSPSETPRKTSIPTSSAIDKDLVKSLLKRIDTLERSVPKFDIDDLVKMKKELLDGDFGTVRYRLGIIESQVQELGGSIAWNNKPEDL